MSIRQKCIQILTCQQMKIWLLANIMFAIFLFAILWLRFGDELQLRWKLKSRALSWEFKTHKACFHVYYAQQQWQRADETGRNMLELPQLSIEDKLELLYLLACCNYHQQNYVKAKIYLEQLQKQLPNTSKWHEQGQILANKIEKF